MGIQIAKITKTNGKVKGNPSELVEYLTPIKDYVPDKDPRWGNIFRMENAKNRAYPKCGFSVDMDSDEDWYIISITQKQGVKGYRYISENYRKLAEEGEPVGVVVAPGKFEEILGVNGKPLPIEPSDLNIIGITLTIIGHNMGVKGFNL